MRLYGAEDRLQAGEYMFEPAVSMEQVLEDMMSGRAVLHSITFPEGMTSDQVVARLIADTVLDRRRSRRSRRKARWRRTLTSSRAATRASRSSTRWPARRSAAVDEAWSRRAADLPLASPEEFVTLASIVEKETGRPTSVPESQASS